MSAGARRASPFIAEVMRGHVDALEHARWTSAARGCENAAGRRPERHECFPSSGRAPLVHWWREICARQVRGYSWRAIGQWSGSRALWHRGSSPASGAALLGAGIRARWRARRGQRGARLVTFVGQGHARSARTPPPRLGRTVGVPTIAGHVANDASRTALPVVTANRALECT